MPGHSPDYFQLLPTLPTPCNPAPRSDKGPDSREPKIHQENSSRPSLEGETPHMSSQHLMVVMEVVVEASRHALGH